MSLKPLPTWFKFSLLGVTSNLVLLLIYYFLTSLNVGHKVSMTVVYMIGVSQTFIVNRNWVFDSNHAPHGQFVRYVAVYVVGYVINWSILYVAVDVFQENHMIAQCASIVIVALFSFLMSKKFVFVARHENSIQ